MTAVDPAIAWLEQQAAQHADILANPALAMQAPNAPTYLRYEQTSEATR